MNPKKLVTASIITLALLSEEGVAVPIASYEGSLTADTTFFGQIAEPDRTGSPADDFWWFSGTAGQVITLTVNRLEAALDPAFYLYFGTGVDTGALTFIARADDNIPELPGFAGPYQDPQLASFTLPSTGNYTVQVWSYESDSPGPDGLYDYQITLGTPPAEEVLPNQPGNGVQPFAVPEPASLGLLGLGLVGLAAARRRKSA